MLPQHRADAGPRTAWRQLAAADARAFSDPVGVRPQAAAQLPFSGEVAAVPRAQREILGLTRLVIAQPGRAGKAIIGIGPHRGLLGIPARGADALG
jgi:hypothetical protein